MDRIQIRQYEMLGRTRDFGTTYAHLFSESSLALQMFLAVAVAVQQLSAYTVAKLSSVQGTTTKAMARAALTDRLTAIGQTGRAIAEHTPGLEEKFVFLITHQSAQALLMTARVFAQDAAPLADRFIAHDMPKTFLADLAQSIADFEQAIHERVAGRDERIAAREHIAAALASGLSAVRALDAIVVNRLHDDPATMAVWKRDRRVQYPGRQKSAVAEPVPAPAPPVDAHTEGVTQEGRGSEH